MKIRPSIAKRESLIGWFLHDGYLWDWLVAVALYVINRVVPKLVPCLTREYSPDDKTLAYPLREDTISGRSFYTLCFGVPITVFMATAAWKKSFADGHHALLSIVEGYVLSEGWKKWMNKVGRLRPNWLATVAAYKAGSHHIENAREAYPSGHAANLFMTATILACFLMGKMKVMAEPSQALFVKLLVCLAPTWLATFVAMTRLADYKHDFADVNAGCFIGMAAGLLAYFLNYPSLFSPQCHQPKLRSRVSALTAGAVTEFGACPEVEPLLPKACLSIYSSSSSNCASIGTSSHGSSTALKPAPDSQSRI